MSFNPQPLTKAERKSLADKTRQLETEHADRMRAAASYSLRDEIELERKEQSRLQAERQAPIIAVEKEHARLLRELQKSQQQNLLNNRDPNVYMDPDTPEVIFGPPSSVGDYNASQVRLYLEQHPEYNGDADALNNLARYFEVNNLKHVHVNTLARAVERLNAAGLISARTLEEEETTEPVTRPITLKPVEEKGEWGYVDGVRAFLTNAQVYRLSSEEYKKFARPSKTFAEFMSAAR